MAEIGWGPDVDADGVTFAVPDDEGAFDAVWLRQEVAWPRSGPELERVEGGWRTHLDRPPVDRIEYLFEVLHRDGASAIVCDPGNPRRAPGAFGDKSVVEFPDYRPPDWLAAAGTVPAGVQTAHALRSDTLGGDLPVRVWAPPDAEPHERLPLLIVHDGFEYDDFSGLTAFLAVSTATGALPRLRAALLHPVDRDAHYSASPEYAHAVGREVLPALSRLAPAPAGRRFRVGMGASLGALAMLHVHRSQPAALGGLFLQSGSFFHHRYFRHELSFPYVDRIRWFMDRVHATRSYATPAPVGFTCGKVEMNLASNRAVALAMSRQGYDVTLTEVRDAHNWTAWRDAWTPALVDLLTDLWG